MKANLKGTGGIKGLLLLHGEKLGMAIVGLCAAGFLFYSLQQQYLPEKLQAGELQKHIREANSAVEGSKWPEPGSELAGNVRVNRPISPIGEKDVLPESYKTSPLGWDTPVITPTVPRTDPALLAAVDVRGTGGCGLFGFLDERVRHERALALKAEEDKRAKEEEKKRLKELNNTGNEGNSPRRGREGEAELGREPVDPEHPNRRMVENNVPPAGAALQGDERIEQVYWATVVAKVPIKEQLKLYRDAFENARGGFQPEFDFPKYLGFVVERAEVQRGQDLKWEKVEVKDPQGKSAGPFIANQVMQKLFHIIGTDWPPPQPEVVDERYLDFEGLLIYPLPPLVGRDWGAEATHPDIPLAINAPPPEDESQPVDAPIEKPAGTDETDIFDSGDPNAQPMTRPGGLPGGPGGRFPGRGEFSGRSGRGMIPGGERGMMPGGDRGMIPGGERGMMPGGERGGGRAGGSYMFNRPGGGQRTTLARGVDSWLLRFFDFTVEPGKKYRYRVQLVMSDPNNQPGRIEESVLDTKVLARQRESAKKRAGKGPSPILYTAWSEPSPTIGIPLGGSSRLAEVKAPNGKLFNDEPTVKLLVESFDKDAKGNWIQAGKEFDFRRGAVANSVSKAEYLVEGSRAIDPKDDFKFNTGITVLDVDGGEKLSKDLQAPARVLLMDATGQVYVRNELDDSYDVEVHRLVFAEPDKKKGRRGEEGMERGGPGGPGSLMLSPRGERGR